MKLVGRHSQGLKGALSHFLCFFLSFWAVANMLTKRMLLLGSRAQQVGVYASSEHQEIIHVLIGMIFSKEIRNNFWSAVPWYLYCLGLQQKAWQAALSESLCYCFLPVQGWTSISSLPVRIMVCLWADKQHFFPLLSQLSALWREGTVVVFIQKIRHVLQ